MGLSASRRLTSEGVTVMGEVADCLGQGEGIGANVRRRQAQNQSLYKKRFLPPDLGLDSPSQAPDPTGSQNHLVPVPPTQDHSPREVPAS